MKNGDMPAQARLVVTDTDMSGNPIAGYEGGLTKREYFAAMAMQGFCADESTLRDNIAMYAVIAADALLAELEKGNE